MTRVLFLLLSFSAALSSLSAQVTDDIITRSLQDEKQVIPYPVLREGDILWQMEVWREIDVREKMNQAFLYPEAPFFELIKTAAWAGELPVYNNLSDDFSEQLDARQVEEVFVRYDTAAHWDGESWGETFYVIRIEMDYQEIKRIRLKEIWYVDSRTGELHVRIIGMAPLRERHDADGNYLYEYPIFWVYYPHLRPLLSRHRVFMPGNDAAAFTWEDLFESRKFSSVIYKNSNVLDLRLRDVFTGADRLLEADHINSALFDLEDGLWSH